MNEDAMEAVFVDALSVEDKVFGRFRSVCVCSCAIGRLSRCGTATSLYDISYITSVLLTTFIVTPMSTVIMMSAVITVMFHVVPI